jgi:uncharacterized protein
MTGERDIDYESLVRDAMRSVVRSVLTRVAKSGLPGDHHFYIAFRTNAPGVNISPRLREKYPEEMTVVLQHRFWDLTVSETRFEVNLTFDSIPERLSVPFSAVKVFFDPSVPYGLQFEDIDLGGGTAQQLPPEKKRASEKADRVGDAMPAEKKPRASRRPPADKPEPRTPVASSVPKTPTKPTLVPDKASEPAPRQTKVVSIDAFRKK